MIQQRFVTDGRRFFEEVFVVEGRKRFTGLQHRAGLLRLERHAETLIGRDAQREHVAGFEQDRDRGDMTREPFARAYVERHAAPAMIIDLHGQRSERFGVRIARDVFLIAIRAHRFAVNRAGGVLTARGVLRLDRADRSQELDLCIAHVFRVERERRFHRGHREQAEKMIRDHVAQRAGRFVELAAVFDTERFGGRDLDRIDVLARPHRLEDAVLEAQRHDALHGFFAEEMIDAVDLRFRRNLQQAAVERARRRQIGAERFFDRQPPERAVRFFEQPGAAEALCDRGEEAR